MAKKKSNINKYTNGLEINKIYSKISRGSSFIPGVIDESKLTSRIVKKDETFKAKPFAKSYKSIRPVLSSGFSGRSNFRTNYTSPSLSLPLILDTYSGAAAAYSVRKLSSSYSGSALRVRRSSDNAEQDIGFSGGDLDTSTLEEFVNVSAPLLDTYSGAAAAYSVRKISSTYSGSALRVRRSSDNAEQDIGFIGNDLDTTTMESFCGAGDGFVVTWYDQSGNGVNATQATAADQPQIVSSGSTLLENGKPVIRPADGTDHLETTVDGSANTWNFSVIKFNVAAAIDALYNATGTNSSVLIADVGQATASINGATYSAVYADGSALATTTRDDIATATTNQALVTVSVNDSGLANISLGYDLSTGVAMFNMQEFIYYTSDQSANRTAIEQNINNYFSIYTQDNDGFVVTWYDQSGNSSDATNATAVEQSQIVNSGVTVTEGTRPAATYDGTMSYSLTRFSYSNLSVSSVYKLTSLPANGSTIFSQSVGFIQKSGQATTAYPRFQIYDTGYKTAEFQTTALNAYNHQIGLTDAGTARIFVNGVAGTTQAYGTINNPNNVIKLGDFPTAANTGHIGTIQEIIAWDSNEAANRAGIQSNTNSYYTIY